MFQLPTDRLPDLLTVFLGIFLEASPFLLIGVLVSSAVEVAVSADRLARWFPRNALLALVGGVAIGAAAPLCECGTVPIARGCVSRGLPLPAAVGFLLAAPVINPITVAATYTAFHNDLSILVWRLSFGVGIALLVGGLFILWPRDQPALRTPREVAGDGHHHAHHGDHAHREPHLAVWSQIVAVLEHAGGELTSLMVYLVGAAAVASLLQVFLPRTALTSLGHGPLLSIAVMMAIAVVLSTCSSVDAFVALAFSTTFAPGAILAFLLVSPVLNLKSGALVVGLFRPTVVGPLLGAATATVALAGLAVNYHLL